MAAILGGRDGAPAARLTMMSGGHALSQGGKDEEQKIGKEWNQDEIGEKGCGEQPPVVELQQNLGCCQTETNRGHARNHKDKDCDVADAEEEFIQGGFPPAGGAQYLWQNRASFSLVF